MTFSTAKTFVPAKSPRLLAEAHRDPRGLWLAAIAISAISHLALGWVIVRVLLVEGKPAAKSQEIIRVEAVALQQTSPTAPQSLARVETPVSNPQPQAPEQRSPVSPERPAVQANPAVPTQPQPATPETVKKEPTWRWFRSGARNPANDAPESALADAPADDTPEATGTRQWRTARDLSANRPSRSSAVNASPLINDAATSARGDSSSANRSVRRYSGSASGSDSMWNDSPAVSSSPRRWSSGGNNSGSAAPGGSASAPSPAATPSSRGTTVSLGAPRLTRPNRDVPDRLAAPIQSSQQLSALPFGVRLDGRSVLEVTAVIEANGKATVYGTRVVSGSLSAAQAQQIGKQLVESWTFRPTYMGDRAVAQDYIIQLSLAPLVE